MDVTYPLHSVCAVLVIEPGRGFVHAGQALCPGATGLGIPSG